VAQELVDAWVTTYNPPANQALDALVAPARILLREADDQLLQLVIQRWSPVAVTGNVHDPATMRRCQRSSVSGLTRKQDQRDRGNTRLIAASRARSLAPAGDVRPGDGGR